MIAQLKHMEKHMLRGLCLLLCILISPLASAVTCDKTIGPGTDNISAWLGALSSGESLCLLSGTYFVTRPIMLADEKKIFGQSGLHQDVDIIPYSTTYSPSDALDEIVHMSANTEIAHVTISYSNIRSGSGANYAILAYQATNSVVWDVQISGNASSPILEGNTYYGLNKGIDILFSDNFQLLASNVDYVGYPDGYNHDAIYIQQSNDALIEWGRTTDLGNGAPKLDSLGRTTIQGAGGTSCYQSDGLRIVGTHFLESGTSGIYLVGCTNTTIDSAYISDASGWGVDAPYGNTNLLVENSTIQRSGMAASVFGEYAQDPQAGSHPWAFAYGAIYTNDRFLQNGDVNCYGINVLVGPNNGTNPPTLGNINAVTQTNNALYENGILQPASEYICRKI